MKPTAPTPQQGSWYIPYRLMQLADGSTLVKPLKPVQVMSARETSKFLGISTKTLARLAESGFIPKTEIEPRISRLATDYEELETISKPVWGILTS